MTAASDAVEIVNPVPAEEIEPWVRQLGTSLLHQPWDDSFASWIDAWQGEWLPDRAWGARSRGRWVGTLATEPQPLVVPGFGGRTAEVMTDGLTAVSVSATHRRRGLLRAMISRSLDAAVERGDALATLIAAEWPIYGRYGYAPATRAANYTLFTARPGGVVAPAPAGVLRQVTEAELHEVARSVFDRARVQWPGQVGRSAAWWARRLGQQGFRMRPERQGTWILHEGEDGPDGFLCWRPRRDAGFDGAPGAIDVTEFVSASATAYRNLWAYLSAVDLVGEVAIEARPLDEPVRWLLADGRALQQTLVSDFLWLRVLDVCAALSARGYATPGTVVLEVVDTDAGGWAAGRYRLEAGADAASCTRTDGEPELRLTARVLAAAYLGDHALRALAVGGGVEELAPGALTCFDLMLSTPVRPWDQTMF